TERIQDSNFRNADPARGDGCGNQRVTRERTNTMDIPLPQVLPTTPDAPSPCRMLRTKTAFGTFEGAPHDWQLGDSTTAVYWCLLTMATSGPDNEFAHPQTCGNGRGCFQKEIA